MNHLDDLLNLSGFGPTPRISAEIGLEWSVRMFDAFMSPGDTAGQSPHFKNQCCRLRKANCGHATMKSIH